MDIYVAEDSELTLENCLYKILPGSDVTVDGTLNIKTTFAVYETFKLTYSPGITGKTPDYPNSSSNFTGCAAYDPELYDGENRPGANLTVRGTLNIEETAKFSGYIQAATAGATVNIAETAILTNSADSVPEGDGSNPAISVPRYTYIDRYLEGTGIVKTLLYKETEPDESSKDSENDLYDQSWATTELVEGALALTSQKQGDSSFYFA